MKIRIIGAGPSGLTAAINLARDSHDVHVYEKNPDVGGRFNNDFQGLENWSSEEDVLNELKTMVAGFEGYCKPVHKGLLRGPDVLAKISSEKPIFYLVKRGSDPDTLDSALRKQALDAGVKMHFNARVDPDNGDIIATGPRKARIFALGVVFETDVDDVAAVIMDNTVAPKGYAYFMASEGRATLATVLFEKFEGCSGYLDNTIRKFQEMVRFDMRNEKRFSGYGNFFLSDSAMDAGKLYVGEAAGFQDSLFGFGMRYAIVSGYLAARSIVERVNYDVLWKDRFSRQLDVSLRNRVLYELFGSVAYNRLIKKTSYAEDPRILWSSFYNSAFSSLFSLARPGKTAARDGQTGARCEAEQRVPKLSD